MSEVTTLDLEELPVPVCDQCGLLIKETGQDCPAVDDGGCLP